MALLIFFVALAIGVSFLCSILEAVLLSVTPSYMALLEAEKPKQAEKLKKLKEDVERPLAAILSLNTIAHTVGAAGAGAQAAIVFGDAALGIFSAILTLLILVLSEIIPKTIGASYWKALVPAVIRTLPPLILLLWPLVKMSEVLTKLISGGKEPDVISGEELSALAKVGAREGGLGDQESKIVQNLFRFKELTVFDIMTPRTVVYALSQDETVENAIKQLDDMRFSRIPIFDGSIDHVTGFVLKTDILGKAVAGLPQAQLSELKRELSHVEVGMHLHALFEHLLQNDRHMALVTDDFGGTAGVVTLEDVVETLLGLEIIDEADTIEDLQALARQQWKERALRLGLVTNEVENNADEG